MLVLLYCSNIHAALMLQMIVVCLNIPVSTPLRIPMYLGYLVSS